MLSGPVNRDTVVITVPRTSRGILADTRRSMTLTWVHLKEYTQVSARKNTSLRITHCRVQSEDTKWSDVWGPWRVILKLESTRS